MKVVLAEKPSVARDLANFLGARARCDGYLEGDGYQVTWAFGHLVTLQEPEDYDPSFKRWSLADLPIIPETFALKLSGDDGAKKQFHTIASLFRDADEIICATDAGREGELIFRYILELSSCGDKPLRRLWLSSLTDSAIEKAFAELQPAEEFDALYAAARCRSEADWIVGMNATRNYTVRYGSSGVLWSVGRVQTPVLALIAARDEEIRHFRVEPWFELRTKYRDVVFKFRGKRFGKREEAEQQAATIRDVEFEITGIELRKERVQPPQLFDLTALQREMNQRFGMSAQDTLKCAQSLYEQKLVTYPRTDSRYLTKDMTAEARRVVGALATQNEPQIAKAAARLDPETLQVTARVFDDKKVNDHHAIIPTGKPPGSLDNNTRRVYDAIALRMIAAFYPPCLKEVTVVDGLAGKLEFRANGVRVVDPGWTVVNPPKRKKKDDDEAQQIPEFRKGERGPHDPEVKEGETKPPRPHTENSLLGAMETAGKLVEDEQLKEALKAKGLGTPATRANIIETLLRRKFIAREKKTLRVTDLGRFLLAVIQDPVLKSAEMTGEWESQLKDIEASQLDAVSFMQSISAFTTAVIDNSSQAHIERDRFGDCPRCGKAILEGKRGYGCSAWREGCEYVLWKTFGDVEIDPSRARELLQRGVSLRPLPIDGDQRHLYLTRSGQIDSVAVPRREHQRSDAKHARSRKASTRKSPPQNAPSPASASNDGTQSSRKKRTPAKPRAAAACPVCAAGMVERDKSYSCASWKSGCRFVIWKEIAGKKITKSMAKKLVTNGKTQILKGFVSKSGKKFDARLQVDGERVTFDF